MKTFEEKIEYLKDFLFDVMKPSIREYLRFHNPKEMEEWQSNCCRQTSLITNWFLRDWLLYNESGYEEIQSWEGKFTDTVLDRPINYEHAWIYCVHQDPDKNLLIDIGRNHKPLLCILTPVNKYPRNIPGYEDMVCVRKKRMNEPKLWVFPEHFTSEKIENMIPKLTRYMKSQGVMKRSLHAKN